MQVGFAVCPCGTHAQLVSPDERHGFHFTNQLEVEVFLAELLVAGAIDGKEQRRLWGLIQESVLPKAPVEVSLNILWQGTSLGFEAIARASPPKPLELVHKFLHLTVPATETRRMVKAKPRHPNVRSLSLYISHDEEREVTPAELPSLIQARYEWMKLSRVMGKHGAY